MEVGELDIHLRRRHHIEQAQAKRPRLPGNLRQLGAVGAVTRPAGNGSQRAIVKTIPVNSGGLKPFLRYLQHQKGHHQSHATLYGPQSQNPQAWAHATRHDAHRFHLIVSTKEDHLGDQRSAFIEMLAHQMERDMGRTLEWVAANHYDTPYPHTHIALRGVANERPLYMAKSYLEHGIRDRAESILTRMLGQRQQTQQRLALDQSYGQERLAFNGMVRGTGDPDLWRTVQKQSNTQQQALAGQMGSYRQDHGADAVRNELAQMQQRMQGLHQQAQWQQAQRRMD